MEDFINFDININKIKYKYYKGGEYITMGIVFNSENNEPNVLYKSINSGKMFFCSVIEFFGKVNNEEYNGLRFEECITPEIDKEEDPYI